MTSKAARHALVVFCVILLCGWITGTDIFSRGIESGFVYSLAFLFAELAYLMGKIVEEC